MVVVSLKNHHPATAATARDHYDTTTNTTKQDPLFVYDFGGPIGAFCATCALPLVVMCLMYWTKVGFLDIATLLSRPGDILIPTTSANVLVNCTMGLCLWFVVLVILWKVLPGPVVAGVPISIPMTTTTTTTTTTTLSNTDNKNDKKTFTLEYKLNGHITFWVVLGFCIGFRIPLNDYLYAYYEPLAMMDCVLCFLLSCFLYTTSFDTPQKNPINHNNRKVLAKGGISGNLFYDFWMGRELNPRLGSFDWKVFCELRPGLIGWMLLNLACAQEQYKLTGTISSSMILINLFQGIYIWDALYQERAILTTMDVTTDGFGYMLVFGDLTWVPFTYSVPAKYLVNHDPQLSTPMLIGIVALYGMGYIIFRWSNGQKDLFRRNPNDPRVSQLQYLQTQRGTKLLISGWWGMARKINYTGDYIMGLTYCLLCGFDSIVPYYYAIYFAILLLHRSIRDDEMCFEKYGNDWIEYKRKVPYRFIPGLV